MAWRGLLARRRFVDLAKALVLHEAFSDFSSAAFDSLPGLTMVGPRRLEHLEALVMVRQKREIER